MYLLHIQDKMVPTGDSFKPVPSTLCIWCFWHIQAEIVPTGTPSNKTTPSTLSTGCFCTPRLKWCLRETLTTNPCPECCLWDLPLTHPCSNGAYRKSSHKHKLSMPSTTCFLHIQADTVSAVTSSHEPMPSTMECLTNTSRLKSRLWWCPPTNPCQVSFL